MKGGNRMELNDAKLKQAVDFHGHLCPGLMIGFKAGQVALEELGVARSADEELVAIVETDACSIDAIQTLTGCTAGKGNFLIKNYGKQAFTVGNRNNGQAIRVALKYGALDFEGNVDKEVRVKELYNKPAEDIFTVEKLDIELPPKAAIRDSVQCANCSEPVMETKARLKEGEMLCISCFKEGS